MAIAYLALGANLGDPVATVDAAFAAISRLPHSQLQARSALYRTAPVGIAEQPEFINAAARIETALAPEALLDALLKLQNQIQREPTFSNLKKLTPLPAKV